MIRSLAPLSLLACAHGSFDPGRAGDGRNRSHWGTIPPAARLPLLPVPKPLRGPCWPTAGESDLLLPDPHA